VDFFSCKPAKMADGAAAQQKLYLAEFTHALDTLIREEVNLILQLGHPLEQEGRPAQRYSPQLQSGYQRRLLDRGRSRNHARIISVGQVTGAAFQCARCDRPASDFDLS